MLVPLLITASTVFGISHAAFSSRAPAMGYNTYNARGCTIDQNAIKQDISNFASLGFKNVGYTIFGIDCGWQATSRSANKSITYDAGLFPNGILPLSNQAKQTGFTFGLYTDQGIYSCDTSVFNRVGSLGYEKEDAAQFKLWGVEYMKVDNCFVDGKNNAPKDPRTDFVSRMGAMSNALKANGINGMLTCQWGVPFSNNSLLSGPAQWTPGISTSYRVSDDIATGWQNVERITNQAINVNVRGLNGPGRWMDMDLLEVGNSGMTAAEQGTHFAIWAMFKSALFVSTPLSSLSASAKSVLQNTRLIAVNQDSLSQPVKLVQRYSGNYDLYAGPLSASNLAVLLVDRTNNARQLGVNFAKLNISTATVTNLWTGEVINNARSYTTNVDAHGSVPLRLSNIVSSTPASVSYKYYQAAQGQLSGSAQVANCAGCSGGSKVGYIGQGNGNALTISFTTSASTQDIRFDYLNCEIGYLGSGMVNIRTATISINGGSSFTVEFPLSGYEWMQDVYKSFLVQVSGLRTGGQTNTLTITNPNGYAPDFDRIGVVV